jgi:hypothetical protein
MPGKTAPVVLRRRCPVVVLGMAPAADGASAWSADTPSGQRLAELAGCAPDKLGRHFALDNLVPYAAPSREALRDAGQLYRFVPECWYLLAGVEVTQALGKRSLPRHKDSKVPWHDAWSRSVLSWYESREGVVMSVLPHPSGRNRWYNDERCRAAAQKFLREARWSGRESAQALFERARVWTGGE